MSCLGFLVAWIAFTAMLMAVGVDDGSAALGGVACTAAASFAVGFLFFANRE